MKTTRNTITHITLSAAILLAGIDLTLNAQAPPNSTETSIGSEIQDWKDIKARYEAEKEAWESRSAMIKARTDAMKARIGEVPDSGYTGKVKIDKLAGETEAALLVAKAIDAAAQKIADLVCKPSKATPNILLYSAAQTPDFQAYIAFNSQYSLVYSALDNAINQSDKFFEPSPAATAGPVASGLLLSAMNRLLGYFRTDYEFTGRDLTLSDSMLVYAVANKVSNNGYSVLLPAVYNPVVHSDTISAIKTRMVDLTRKQQIARSRFEHYKELAKSAKGKEVEKYREIAEKLSAAMNLYDTFFADLATATDGKVPLVSVITETALINILGKTGDLLVVTIHKAGGAHYTKKHIFTLFGRTPFFHMGGVVVSFVLMSGKDASVKVSGVVPVHGGFVGAKDIESHLIR